MKTINKNTWIIADTNFEHPNINKHVKGNHDNGLKRFCKRACVELNDFKPQKLENFF